MFGNSHEMSRSPDLPEGASCPCPGFCPEPGPGTLGFAPCLSLMPSVGPPLLPFVEPKNGTTRTTPRVTSRLELKMGNCNPGAAVRAVRAVSSRSRAGNSDSTSPARPVPAVAGRARGGERQLGAGQRGPGWSSPARVMLGGAVSHRVRIATPAPRQDPSLAAFREQETGAGAGGRAAGGAASGAARSGAGRRAGGLKWPRWAAGVGSAMRQGLTPPQKACWERGRQNCTGRTGAAGGSAPPAAPGAGHSSGESLKMPFV